MRWGTDYDAWDTPIGRAQDYILDKILENETERSIENAANKGN